MFQRWSNPIGLSVKLSKDVTECNFAHCLLYRNYYPCMTKLFTLIKDVDCKKSKTAPTGKNGLGNKE